MPPQKGSGDIFKINKIKEVLFKHPEGMSVSEITRESGLVYSTVYHYIKTFMKDIVTETHRVETKAKAIVIEYVLK